MSTYGAAVTVSGLINPMDAQPGEHLIDGESLNVALYPQKSRAGLVALSGGGAGGATVLRIGLNEVDTVAAGADSCLLPLALAGASVIVFNATATNGTTVWPQPSDPNNAASAADTIVNLAGATVASLSVAANAVVTFRCFTPGIWKATV